MFVITVVKDNKISNIKGFLIFLVVFGHFIELYKYDCYEVFTFIYTFHMPLFIFISGYLAKRVKVSKIINLVLLYLIFQSFFHWYLYAVGNYGELEFNYTVPTFHLWYIVSLCIWYLLVWCILKTNPSRHMKITIFLVVLLISFLSRLYTADVIEFFRQYVEFFSSYTFSFQRTLTFAPFFLLGFFMNKHWMTFLYSFLGKSKNILFLTTILFFFIFVERMPPNIEYLIRGSFGYEEIAIGNYYLVNILYYIVTIWLCLLVMNMIPHNQSILTKWGDRSLTIFLFHVVIVFLYPKFEVLFDHRPDVRILTVFILALLSCFLFSSNVFVNATAHLCKPYKTIVAIVNLLTKKRTGRVTEV